MNSSTLYLSKHAFICLADGHYVFLDLRRDEYLCLGRKHTEVLRVVLNRNQTIDEESSGIQTDNNVKSAPSAVINALLQKQLFVEDEGSGKAVVQVTVDMPAESLMKDANKCRIPITLKHIWMFYSAALAASGDLRRGSMEQTVRRIVARKLSRTTPDVAPDKDLADLVQIFQALRPYYPRRYLCLFDSLSLLHFLARFNFFPRWVYGVKLEPFSAHCWVQSGDLIINDLVDNVHGYKPILAI